MSDMSSHGDPVQSTESATVALLSDASPDWVARLSRGATWTYTGALLDLCTSNLAERWATVGPIIGLLPDAAYLAGIWLLTSPEPGHANSSISMRGLARGFCLLSMACELVVAGVGYVPDANVMALRGIGMMFGAVLLFFISPHLASIAMRMPNTRLAGQTRFVLTSLAVMSFLFGGLVSFVESDDAIREAIRGHTIVLWLFVPAVLFTLVLAFASVWVFYRFQKILTEQATRAKSRDKQPC